MNSQLRIGPLKAPVQGYQVDGIWGPEEGVVSPEELARWRMAEDSMDAGLFEIFFHCSDDIDLVERAAGCSLECQRRIYKAWQAQYDCDIEKTCPEVFDAWMSAELAALERSNEV